MADREDKGSGQKKSSKGKSKSHKSGKILNEKGDEGGIKECSPGIMNTSVKSMLGAEQKRESPKMSVDDKSVTKCDHIEGSTHAVKENENKNLNVNKNSGKTREEILAEREAKKLAKQALKKKVKEGNVDKSQPKKENDDKGTMQKVNSEESKGSLQDQENVTQINSKCDKVEEAGVEIINPTELHGKSVDKVTGEGKSKAQLRAERRAKQEAQRAKKLEKTKEIGEEKSVIVDVPKPERVNSKISKIIPPSQEKVHKVKLFSHLYRELYDCTEMDLCEDMHPGIVRLGTQYRSKVISGANARCLALLNALKTVIHDYKTPPNQEFSRGLEAEISKSMAFLNKCRPVAVSMVNAVKHLKFQVNQVKGSEIEAKKQINDWIDTYVKEQIEKAAEAISLFVLEKITDGDVILTYSCSSLIQRTLIKASDANIKFRVIVVDGRPWLDGKVMLRKLVKSGISCTYVFFNGLSFIMPEVTKILLGAHALLANGYVMSRAGSSQIALLAKVYNVPVLVCCETHKFSEKVQTDSFVHNELGDPDKLISNTRSGSKELSKWRTIQYLTPLNLTYDVTPPDLVSAVVTEIAVLPCTSVPVILRVKPPDVTF